MEKVVRKRRQQAVRGNRRLEALECTHDTAFTGGREDLIHALEAFDAQVEDARSRISF